MALINNLPSETTDMTGATSSTDGVHGLVPAPLAGDEDKVLKGDGTWGSSARTIDITLQGGASNWTSVSSSYVVPVKQEVTVQGITTNTNGIISFKNTGGTYPTYKYYGLRLASQETNKLTFYADNCIPLSNIELTIMIID